MPSLRTSSPVVLGLISDTHGLLRETALNAMRGCNLIIHAGDVGKPGILDALREVAPVTVVRGNVDTEEWAGQLPETAVASAGSARIFVLHDLKSLKINPVAQGLSIVVSGHSHKPISRERDGVLYVNPGSAGPRRFQLPITVARIDLRSQPWKVAFIDVSEH
jgi:putative phosphoesterase